MSLFPIRRRELGWSLAALLALAAGCSRSAPRVGGAEEVAPVAEGLSPPGEKDAPAKALTLGPPAKLREPAPNLAVGQTLGGAFRARLGARTHTFDSVCFTPDGLRLVGNGRGVAVLVWDVRTGAEAHRLPVFASAKESYVGTGHVALSPDGRTLASPGRHFSEVWLWDLPTATVRRRLKVPDYLRGVAFTGDGKTLFTSHSENKVLRWDATTGARKATSGKIADLRLERLLVPSPDGKTVVVGADDGSLVFLDGETLKERKRIRGHQQAIRALALSPNGKTLASVASNDGLLKLWDLEKAVEIKALKGDGRSLSAVAFSPSGNFVAAGGGSVTLWDVKTGAEHDTLYGPHGYIGNLNDLAFSPDGTLLAGAPNSSRGVVVWELSRSLQKRTFPREERQHYVALAPGGGRAASATEKGIELRELASGKVVWSAPGERVSAPAFSVDGSLLAFGKSGNKVALVAAASGAPKETLDLQEANGVSCLAFRPDGKRLAVGGGPWLEVWALDGGRPRRLFSEKQRGTVTALVFDPSGKALAFAAGPTLSRADAQTGRAAWTVPAHEGAIPTVAFSPDGGRILTVSRNGPDRAARLWNAVDGKQVATFRHAERPSEACFASDARTVLTVDEQGTFIAWDAGTGKRLGSRRGGSSFTPPAFTPDRKTFLTEKTKGLRLWETAALTREALVGRTDVVRDPPEAALPPAYAPARAVLKGHRGHPTFCAFSADGKRLVSADERYEVVVWGPTSGKAIKALAVRAGENVHYALSADGKRLAVGCYDATLRLWDLETGKQERRLKGHEGFVRCVAFSPDGRWVASGTGGVFTTELFLWDARTGALVKKLARGGSLIDSLIFSPDSKLLVVGSYHDGVRLFEVATGAERPKLEHTEEVTCVAVSPDGTLVAAGGGFSTFGLKDVAVWDLKSGKRRHLLTVDSPNIRAVAFSADGLLAVAAGGVVSLWDTKTGKLVRTFGGNGPLAFSPDGKVLAVERGTFPGAWLELLDVAALRNDRLQQALAPALRLGAIVEPEGDGVRVELELPGGPDSVAALVALAGLPELRSLALKRAEAIPQAAVDALARGKSLRSLAIHASDLRDADLKAIAGLPHLTSLALSDCRELTGPGLAVLAKLSRLEELSLDEPSLDAASLRPLVGLKKLRSLRLRFVPGEAEGPEVLTRFPALTELSVGGGLDGDGLAKLKGMKRLRRLGLDGCDLRDAGLAHLSGLTGLEELDVSRTQATDAGLAHLKALTNLKRLNLSGNELTDAGLAHLSALTRLTSLEVNDLEKLTGTGLAHLRGAKGLTELHLSSTGATDAGLAGLSDLTQLRSLNLPDRITDAGLLRLAKLTALRSINLAALKHVKGPGLAGLNNATALKELDLSGLAVADAGLDGIKGWMHLEVLALPKGITDAGLARLSALKRLTVLRAEDAGIADAGLARLKGLTSLEELDLKGTKITDAGLRELEGLVNLRQLDVRGTGVTEAGAAKLKRLRPDAFIKRY